MATELWNRRPTTEHELKEPPFNTDTIVSNLKDIVKDAHSHATYGTVRGLQLEGLVLLFHYHVCCGKVESAAHMNVADTLARGLLNLTTFQDKRPAITTTLQSKSMGGEQKVLNMITIMDKVFIPPYANARGHPIRRVCWRDEETFRDFWHNLYEVREKHNEGPKELLEQILAVIHNTKDQAGNPDGGDVHPR